MTTKYYYKNNAGETQGPVLASTLHDLRQSGVISGSTLIAAEGAGNAPAGGVGAPGQWVPYESVNFGAPSAVTAATGAESPEPSRQATASGRLVVALAFFVLGVVVIGLAASASLQANLQHRETFAAPSQKAMLMVQMAREELAKRTHVAELLGSPYEIDDKPANLESTDTTAAADFAIKGPRDHGRIIVAANIPTVGPVDPTKVVLTRLILDVAGHHHDILHGAPR
ncbi:hypothetical protein DB346_18665 [Verrucomicrobia bacterium LW23]|nr:hypothetical protein DB346_18665 [Verrucomicrobia bacterium LW23]